MTAKPNPAPVLCAPAKVVHFYEIEPGGAPVQLPRGKVVSAFLGDDGNLMIGVEIGTDD